MDSLNCRYIFYQDGPQTLYWAVKYLGLNERDYYRVYYYKSISNRIPKIFDITQKGLLTLILRLHYNGLPVKVGKIYCHPYQKLRLVFSSADGNTKIFEYVKGAVLTIKAAPNTLVNLNKYVKIECQEFIYSDFRFSNESGIAYVTVPYPADMERSYNVINLNKIRKVQVSESAIIEGDTIRLNF